MGHGVQRSSSSGENQVLQRCSFCDADVRLESPEVAKCSSVESETGFFKHKLQRCSVSLQGCPGNPLWYCSCCARWASALAPASFSSFPRIFGAFVFALYPAKLVTSLPFLWHFDAQILCRTFTLTEVSLDAVHPKERG